MPRPKPEGITVKQRLFLAAIARNGNITAAAIAARCERRRHYEWLHDPEYKEAFDAAQEESVQRLENEVRRRAEEGDPEIVLYQGAPVMEPLYDPKTGEVLRDAKTGRIKYSNRPMIVRRKSDILAMFLLKSMRPDQYRDNSRVQLGGQDGGPLEIRVSFVNPSPRDS